MMDETQVKAAFESLLGGKMRFCILEPFLGATTGFLKPRAAPQEVQMIGVDAVGNLYFDPDWIIQQSSRKMTFVVGHEALHVGLGHFKRGEAAQEVWLRRSSVSLSMEILFHLWDESTNHAVNSILFDRLGFIPDDAQYDPRFHGQSAERVFQTLVKEYEQKAASNSQPGTQPGGSGGQNGFPVPSPSEQGQTPAKDDEAGKGTSQDAQDQPQAPSGGGGWDTHRYDVPSDTDREQALSEINAQVRSLAASLGRAGAGNHDTTLKGMLEQALGVPTIPWAVLLRRYMTATARTGSSWSHLNRRLRPHGVLMPSRRRPAMQDLVMAMDVSGSIAETPKSKFYDMAREAMTVPGTRVHFIAFDYCVYDQPPAFGTFQPGQAIIRPRFLPKGGGTSFYAVWRWIADKGIKPRLVIMLTDADGYLPDTCPGPYEVKWVLTPKYGTVDTYLTPKFGEVVAKI